MKNLEKNKIAASILLAGLIALASGKVADFLYNPEHGTEEKRGYKIEVAEEANTTSTAKSDAPIDISALMKAASAENGANIYKKCASCHALEKGQHKVGPSLYGVVGSAKAHYADYAYSSGLKAKGGKWDYNDLFAFLKKPGAFISGTKMSFAGLNKPNDIADVVAFLNKNSDAPLPNP